MMRWLFVDRIEAFSEWESITTRKAVSFEEFHLMENRGRRGEFPESLLIESCVESFRWLIVCSSGYRQSAVLHSIEDFSIIRPACWGDVISVTLNVHTRQSALVSANCIAESARGKLASGTLRMETIDLDTCFDSSLLRGAWNELYGTA